MANKGDDTYSIHFENVISFEDKLFKFASRAENYENLCELSTLSMYENIPLS